jgi:Na+-transporting methylmalonyl-CoA/oxaloacetate decarboxylase gamma subunit
MNTKYLLGVFLLVATVLAIGAVATSFLSSGLNDSEEAEEANCPEVAPAVSRDADAQSLVDRVEAATVAAHSVNDDVRFYSITIYPNVGPVFNFVANDRLPVLVSFGPDGEPDAREAQVKFRDSPRPELLLDDLSLGPGRARSVVQEQYPSAQLAALGLTRQENCELAWTIGGFIEQDRKPPLVLEAAVNNSTGDVSLPKGPPQQIANVPGPR